MLPHQGVDRNKDLNINLQGLPSYHLIPYNRECACSFQIQTPTPPN